MSQKEDQLMPGPWLGGEPSEIHRPVVGFQAEKKSSQDISLVISSLLQIGIIANCTFCRLIRLVGLQLVAH